MLHLRKKKIDKIASSDWTWGSKSLSSSCHVTHTQYSMCVYAMGCTSSLCTCKEIWKCCLTFCFSFECFVSTLCFSMPHKSRFKAILIGAHMSKLPELRSSAYCCYIGVAVLHYIYLYITPLPSLYIPSISTVTAFLCAHSASNSPTVDQVGSYIDFHSSHSPQLRAFREPQGKHRQPEESQQHTVGIRKLRDPFSFCIYLSSIKIWKKHFHCCSDYMPSFKYWFDCGWN